MRPNREIDIAALVIDRGCRERIRLGLRGYASVHFAESREAMLEILARTTVAAAILEPWDFESVSTEETVHQIRRRFVHLPLLLYMDCSPDAVRRVLALAKAGADNVILRHIDDVGTSLRKALAKATFNRAGDDVVDILSPYAPSLVRPILAYAIAHADEAVSVQDIATGVGVHRKTVLNRLMAAGFPAPSALVSWCRLIVAARLLEDPGRSVEQVAHALRFGSATALRNMLRRHTGLSPRHIRSTGSYLHVVSMLVDRVAHATSAPLRRAEYSGTQRPTTTRVRSIAAHVAAMNPG